MTLSTADCIVSVIDEGMRKKHCRNVTDREKPKYLEKNLSQCHSVDH
jgi:hypothetical protein